MNIKNKFLVGIICLFVTYNPVFCADGYGFYVHSDVYGGYTLPNHSIDVFKSLELQKASFGAGLSRDIGRHFYVNAATRFVSENTKSLYTNTLRCDGFSWLEKFNFGGNFGPLNIQLGKDALDYASSEINDAPCFQMNGMTSNMAKTLPRYQWTASAGLFAGPVFFNASLSTSPFSGKIFDSKLKAYCVSISVDVPYFYAKFAGGIMERNALDNVKSFSAMVGIFTENDGEDWSGSLYFSWMNNSAVPSELRSGETTASFNGLLDIPFDGFRCDIAVNAGYEKTGSLFPIFIADKLVGTNGNWFAGMMIETYYEAIGMGVAATWHPQLKQWTIGLGLTFDIWPEVFD